MELIRSDLVKNGLASDAVVALLKKTVPAMDKNLLKGKERADMWEHLVRYNPQYGRYQDGTERTLPVMLLYLED